MAPIVEIFCIIDDFCKHFEQVSNRGSLCNPERKRQRAYRMTLSEIMTILVMFHLSQYRTFKDFYTQFVQIYWRSEFPRLVSYNRFVELMKDSVIPLIVLLKCCSGSRETGKYYIDSTKLCVCHNMRISRHKVFKGLAQRGKTSTGWFFGFKLHLVLDEYGELVRFTLTSGNKDDRSIVQKLVTNLKGWLFGDRGYISEKLSQSLHEQGLELITRLKKNMKEKPITALQKFFLNQRNLIETAIGQLKEICHVQHTRHRSPNNFLANLLSGLMAYVFKPKKPHVTWKFHISNLSLISN